MTDFLITSFRPQVPPYRGDSGVTTVAYATVTIGPVKIVGARLILDDIDGRMKLSWPSGGRYQRMFILDRPLKDRIRAAAIAALKDADTPLATASVASGSDQ